MQIEDEILTKAKEVAKEWQIYISQNREKSEIEFHETMKRMLRDPLNKIFLIELLDQSFRSKNPARVANQLEFIFNKYENTSFFSDFEKVLIFLFRKVGLYMPGISIPLFIKYLREDISDIVIKGEDEFLTKHLRMRKKEGTRVNINIIGEIVLGEEEADNRVKKYVSALQNPDIDYISIKISTLFSQISPIANKWSVEKISQKLEKIYDAAMENMFVDADLTKSSKFVNLDMEEYKDINLTIDTFMNTLSKDKYKSLYAGIVLQSYLPDTLEYAKKLSEWAIQRVKSGGTPIKVRLVKGANQEMELTEASLRGWPCVTYTEKKQSDANFKILMDYLLRAQNAPYVHVGIASHNIFDQALGMLLAKQRGVEKFYTAEMLEGMSEAAYKLLKKNSINVILYAPTATLDTFTNAIAYLVRRFDENSAKDNFLRHSFGLEIPSKAWDKLVESYDSSLDVLKTIPQIPYRKQDRNIKHEKIEEDIQTYRFQNEPDTDFSLPQNMIWADEIVKKYKNLYKSGGYSACSVIGAQEIKTQDIVKVIDKSQYHEKVFVGSYSKSSQKDVQKAISIAKDDVDGWRGLDSGARQKILMDVADEFRKQRADFIGIAAAEVGKVFSESDVEVSEAIDFLNFYPYSVRAIEALDGITTKAKGVGLVISPWNFPIAIATGGIAAALAAGNTVILKPASDSVLCAYMVCECFWRAGVSKNTLQLVLVDGESAGKTLIPSEDIDFVIFTGSEKSAYEIIKAKPSIYLSAETGGKNATIVTAMADRDQAVKNVVASAFNNSGQKCSATSLLVLEKEVYNDENFKRMLVDAASSLEVGSVWELKNRVGALSSLPSGNLLKVLNHLDNSERWLIKPSFSDNENPYMLKPSLRWDTKKGDFCHMNELFGPVLSVMCAENLEDAIDIVNATGYGLTAGLESLDEREQDIFKEKVIAGNLYINRMTTGAIVTRQPFGGMRKSAIGSGKKAGGFNYVAQFMKIKSKRLSTIELLNHTKIEALNQLLYIDDEFYDDVLSSIEISKNFSYWLNKEFNNMHDYCNIRGESNHIKYLPAKSVLLRVSKNDEMKYILSCVTALKMIGSKVYISVSKNYKSTSLKWLNRALKELLDTEDAFVVEDEDGFINSLSSFERVRVFDKSALSASVYKNAADKAIYIASEPFVENGRIELMHYFIEQSISHSYHRYGNLGSRSLEK